MTASEIASQIIFWSLVVCAIDIAREFKRSKDPGLLRKIIIDLFITMSWCYGLAGSYYLLWDLHIVSSDNLLWLRLACNIPVFGAMIRFRRYIKKGNKKAASV